MKILIAIPCLYNAHVCSEAINSVLNRHGVDVLLLDNGADQDVKDVLEKFKEYSNVTVIHEPTNIYVNPAWQKFIDYFLAREKYTHLIIMNSDLVMQHDFYQVLLRRWEVEPNEILIPTSVDKVILKERVSLDIEQAQKVSEGVAGVFITLTQRQAYLVSPLPEGCKIWFGDSFIYSMLSALGYTMLIPINFRAHHIGSETVKRLPELMEVLEEDKFNWETFEKPKMNKLIHYIKNQ